MVAIAPAIVVNLCMRSITFISPYMPHSGLVGVSGCVIFNDNLYEIILLSFMSRLRQVLLFPGRRNTVLPCFFRFKVRPLKCIDLVLINS